MADPPDLPLSLMKDVTSLGEAQGSDEVTTQGLDLAAIQMRGEEVHRKSSEDGLSVQSPRGLDAKTENQIAQGGILARLNGSWVGVVQVREVNMKEKENKSEGEKMLEVKNKEVHEAKEFDEVVEVAINQEVKSKESINLRSEVEKTPESKKLESKSEWEDVTPGKTSRSPNTRQKELEFGHVYILMKSRFSVLTPVDEGELPDHENDQVEHEEEGSSSEEKEEEVGEFDEEQNHLFEKEPRLRSQLSIKLKKLDSSFSQLSKLNSCGAQTETCRIWLQREAGDAPPGREREELEEEEERDDMGERKVLNKYYPPDFDPSKLPRLRRPKNQQIKVRMMLPMSVRCNTCGNYIYMGTKFNSRKEDVIGETYLGIQIFRFYFKCTKCSAELTMKTDPQNSDYIVESGASRNYEPWRAEDEAVDKEQQKRDAEEMGDAMKSLENRTLDS
ncbi:hypothetical protein F2Q69_00026932 [Brassica cretica]|uniref:Splicing factor YJU2 n=1 Tax=Brassica cretica TaxID=69181 RepID=A0A8S9S0U1_BRACR|nr:hypothetical protein F2Q69_00026932 [Brassica cretica]